MVPWPYARTFTCSLQKGSRLCCLQTTFYRAFFFLRGNACTSEQGDIKSFLRELIQLDRAAHRYHGCWVKNTLSLRLFQFRFCVRWHLCQVKTSQFSRKFVFRQQFLLRPIKYVCQLKENAFATKMFCTSSCSILN